MTIKECQDRKKLYKHMLANLDAIKLALERSIAIEELNIKELNKAREQK